MSRTVIILIGIWALAGGLRAQGYIDPGAGAMLWQILAAFFLGVVFVFRRFVFRWFRKKNNPPDS